MKMLKKNIRGKDIYYYDSDDVVVNKLKDGELFGDHPYKIIKEYIKSGETIIDCGCHIGTFTVSALLGDLEVIAIDGASKNIQCLKETAKQFPEEKLHIFNEIISNSVSPCSFSEEYGPFGWLVEDPDGKLTSNTVDNICKDDQYKVSAIKYDLEGGEEAALKGSEFTIKQHKPLLLIEINQELLLKRNMIRSIRNIVDTVRSYGYECYLPLAEDIYKIDKHLPRHMVDILCFDKEKAKQYDILKNCDIYGSGQLAWSINSNSFRLAMKF